MNRFFGVFGMVLISLVFSFSERAEAWIYTADSDVHSSQYCYPGSAPWNIYKAVKEEAVSDACHQAKWRCLTEYGAEFPKDIFNCEIKESWVTQSSDSVWQLGEGQSCSDNTMAMAYAKASCIAEAIPTSDPKILKMP